MLKRWFNAEFESIIAQKGAIKESVNS
jgi:hypothetical protein